MAIPSPQVSDPSQNTPLPFSHKSHTKTKKTSCLAPFFLKEGTFHHIQIKYDPSPQDIQRDVSLALPADEKEEMKVGFAVHCTACKIAELYIYKEISAGLAHPEEVQLISENSYSISLPNQKIFTVQVDETGVKFEMLSPTYLKGICLQEGLYSFSVENPRKARVLIDQDNHLHSVSTEEYIPLPSSPFSPSPIKRFTWDAAPPPGSPTAASKSC